jgi:hypothetical protein
MASEFPQGSENAALETLRSELGKEAPNGVEPGSRCWGEVEDKPRMFFEPLHDVGMLMGGIVVAICCEMSVPVAHTRS